MKRNIMKVEYNIVFDFKDDYTPSTGHSYSDEIDSLMTTIARLNMDRFESICKTENAENEKEKIDPVEIIKLLFGNA